MKIWTVMALKGGVGKTTTVVNLAGSMTQRGYRVLAVDLDPHGSISSYFGFDPDNDGPSVYDIFNAAAENTAVATQALPRSTVVDGLQLLPSCTSLVSLERRCGTKKGMGRVLQRELATLASNYDYCLIDCPPTLGMLNINALSAADLLLVPLQTENLALRSLDRLQRTLDLFAHSIGRKLPSLVVPTMFDRRTRASRDTLLSLRCLDDINLWPGFIPVDTQLREASRLGVPLTHWQTDARASKAYERLLDYLLGEKTRHLRVAS